MAALDTSGGPPIFVVGTPRSGTTLTARILGRHSAIFMPGETHFFEDIYNRRQQLGSTSSPEVVTRLKTLYLRYNEHEDHERIQGLFCRTEFEGDLRAAASYEELFARFMEFQMRAAGKRRWGNQAPRDLFEIDKILEIFPHARIIACVRDVRDFLASYRDNWRETSEEDARRIRALYHPVITSLLWRSSMRQLTTALHAYGGRIRISRYEDLVRDPQREAAELCRFIGESFEPDMLEVTKHNSSTTPNRGGIFTSSVGRWTTSLSLEEARIGELIAGRYLAQFGYRRTLRPFRRAALVASFLSAPVALFKGLRANSSKRGPLLPYLARRVRALLRYRTAA